MIVDISNLQNDHPIDEKEIERVVQSVIEGEGRSCDEVSITFVDRERISQIHADYFDDPTPTDCISIPMDCDGEEPIGESHFILGDVIVCPSIAIEYAANHGVDVDDEVKLYVVHGLLHLLGYDDIDPEERKKMRDAEAKHMKALQTPPRHDINGETRRQ